MSGERTPNDPIAHALREFVDRQLPRVLTQLDRDPDSPTMGCFDRNHWHYKIRDYPSSILQQGVFLLEALRRGDIETDLDPTIVTRWTVAAVNALARQVDRRGGVDEYYPFERSYPAAAFGLHAVVRVLGSWREDAPDLLDRVDWRPLRRLAQHLASRFEPRASNQQGIGLAALAMCLDHPELGIEREQVDTIADRFFALQHAEGWFEEYGGPDTGYLAVTLDALADYGDATGDPRAAAATTRAVRFLATVIGADGKTPGTLNSRNTDYVVPYGLARAAVDDALAAWVLETCFEGADSPEHFLAATDDRYHCHYIYASAVRALPWLVRRTESVSPRLTAESWLPGSGLWIRRSDDGAITVAVSARKGGLVRVHRRGAPAEVEHGWRLNSGKSLWTTNFWNDAWTIEKSADEIRISGPAVAARPLTPTPFRHAVLRAAAWIGRERLIPLLKRALIFRGGSAGPHFERSVRITDEGVRITDRFRARPGTIARPSPRQNLRHVASADSYHVEDGRLGLLGNEPIELREDREIVREWVAGDRLERQEIEDTTQGSSEEEPTYVG